MTGDDAAYISTLINDKVFDGPVLELGAGYGGATCRKLITTAGFHYCATDMIASEGVTYIADFSNAENITQVFGSSQFGCVLVLNVLEHTFDPIRVLDCAMSLVRSGGKLIVITPSVWPLHNYPIDCYRLLPDWYAHYAALRGCRLLLEHFDFVGYGRISSFIDQDGCYQFPPPVANKRIKYLWSRLIHKTFNTYGRGMAFPSHVAIGAVFSK